MLSSFLQAIGMVWSSPDPHFEVYCSNVSVELLVDVEQSYNGDVVELFAALEEWNLDYEEVADQSTPELLDEVASGSGGTTY